MFKIQTKPPGTVKKETNQKGVPEVDYSFIKELSAEWKEYSIS